MRCCTDSGASFIGFAQIYLPRTSNRQLECRSKKSLAWIINGEKIGGDFQLLLKLLAFFPRQNVLYNLQLSFNFNPGTFVWEIVSQQFSTFCNDKILIKLNHIVPCRVDLNVIIIVKILLHFFFGFRKICFTRKPNLSQRQLIAQRFLSCKSYRNFVYEQLIVRPRLKNFLIIFHSYGVVRFPVKSCAFFNS